MTVIPWKKRLFQNKSWLLILVMSLATFLRVYQLGHEGLWADEMASIQDSENYWQNPTARRPFYFILLNLWMQLGQGDIWLRSLAVLFGIGAVWLTYCVGERSINQETGLVAALLMAVSPLFINHSQEIRMYSLSSFLSLLGTLFLLRTFWPQASGWAWRISIAGWAVSRWLAILTMPLNIVLLLPDMLLFGDRTRKHKAKHKTKHQILHQRTCRQPYRLFGLGLGFTLAASMPTLLAQTVGGAAQDFFDSQAVDYSKPGYLQVLGMITQFSSHWPLRFFLEQEFQTDLAKNELNDTSLFWYFFTNLNGPLIAYAVMTLTVLSILGFALAQSLGHRQAFSFTALAGWALIPSAAVLMVSYVGGSIWFPRYLLGFAPYYLLLIAAGFVRLWRWRWLSLAIAAGYALAVVTSLNTYYGPVPYRNDWKTASAMMNKLEQPGDVIIYHSLPRHYNHSFPRYYQGQNEIYFLDRPKNIEALEIEYIQQSLPNLIEINSRFWVVCWWYCSDATAAENIARSIAGDNVILEQQVRLNSLGNYPIHIYLFTPENLSVIGQVGKSQIATSH